MLPNTIKNLFNIINSNPKAWIAGLLDTSICLSYLLSIPVEIWYSGIILIKILLILFFGASSSGAKAATPFLALTSLATLVTLWKSEDSIIIAINYFGFSITLLLTSMLIKLKDIQYYLHAIAVSGLTISTIYIAMATTGLIPDHYGRMLFFGGAHPNLGGESIAIFLVAALASFKKQTFLFAWCIMTSCIYLMQARAALLVAILAILVYSWHIFTLSGRSRITYLIIGIILLTFTLPLYLDTINHFFSQVFMTTDESRGLGTGFVGREERWLQALEVFASNPFLGGGFAAFDADGMLSPHNYFLAGLAYLGATSFIVFSYIALGLYRLAKFNSNLALSFIPLIPLFIFNDRFMNLNPYPFIFYVVILAFIANGLHKKPLSLNIQ